MPPTFDEIKGLFEDFLLMNGLTDDFKDFIEQKGYTMKELGISDGDD